MVVSPSMSSEHQQDPDYCLICYRERCRINAQRVPGLVRPHQPLTIALESM